MGWIKRNLVFSIICLAAVLAMGAGVWYLFSKMGLNKNTETQLNEAYTTLDNLTSQTPGDPKAVEDQTRQLRETADKFRDRFRTIPSIPYTTNVAQITSAQFATTLQVTIDQLQRGAGVASVELPMQYAFSFQAERSLMRFAPGSLGPLSVQLGEVKAICDILYGARVNALLSIQRERVSADDETGGPENYLPPEAKSISTEMGTVTPYQISFRCFGGELSAVLTAFATSPYCFIVQSVNVEPAIGGMSSGGGSRYGDSEVARPAVNPALARSTLSAFLDEEQIRVTILLQIVKVNSAAKR